MLGLESKLDKGLDFLTLGLKNPGKRGQPSKSIWLTVDGFKMFCQAAETEKGKQIERQVSREDRAA